jgi:hypothetical protein
LDYPLFHLFFKYFLILLFREFVSNNGCKNPKPIWVYSKTLDNPVFWNKIKQNFFPYLLTRSLRGDCLMDKKSLTEADICTKFITPALVGADGGKWNVMTQLREEIYFTKGRVIVRGKTVKRGEAKKVDYFDSGSTEPIPGREMPGIPGSNHRDGYHFPGRRPGRGYSAGRL